MTKRKNFEKYLSSIFLFSIFYFLFSAAVVQAQSLIPCSGLDCDFNAFIALIQRVINFLIVGVAIPLSMILFAYAGWLYMSAGGDTGKIDQGHKIFVNVAIGLIIALAAWLVIYTITVALISERFPQEFFFLKR